MRLLRFGFLLHFDYFEDAAHRKQYKARLKNYLGHPYKKNSKDMYDILFDKQEIAIRNSKKLLAKYTKFNPEKNNPSTNVHELVNRLNERLSD